MFDTVKVGRIISQKRKEHNMTQMQLADALGISFQAVSNWERGNSMPDISKLPELAELFGCSIEELLGGGTSAGNVEKLAKGEGQGLSLGEIAEVAPVLTPEVLDEAVESARRETPSVACGDSSLQEGAEEKGAPCAGARSEGAEGKGTHGDSVRSEGAEEGEDASSCRPLRGGSEGAEGADDDFDEDIDEESEDDFDDDFDDEEKDEEKAEEPRRFHAFWKRTGRGARAHIRDGKHVYILGAEKSGERKKDKAKSKRLKELVMLAPFLSSARLHELVEELQGEGYTVSELVPLAPFLSEEDLDALAEIAEADGGELAALAPFLSQETLKRLAERGGVKSGQLVALAPFLSQEVLEELVLQAIERGERIPRGLYPFLSERAIVEILKRNPPPGGALVFI